MAGTGLFCHLTWHPSVLSAVNLDHFQILRAIGKGSFGKVRPAGRGPRLDSGVSEAGPSWVYGWRVWVCFLPSRPVTLGPRGGLSAELPAARVS